MEKATIRIVIFVAAILAVSICLMGCNDKPIPNVLMQPKLPDGSYTGKVVSYQYNRNGYGESYDLGHIILDIGEKNLITIGLNSNDNEDLSHLLFSLARVGMFLRFTVKNVDIPSNDWQWVSKPTN